MSLQLAVKTLPVSLNEHGQFFFFHICKWFLVAYGRHENDSFLSKSRITQVHWEERKGEELQPHNCAQVFVVVNILSLFYLSVNMFL